MAKPKRKATENVVTMPRPASTTSMLSQSTNPTANDIARRAFELYCERGCQEGRDVEDWLQAERELRQMARVTAA